MPTIINVPGGGGSKVPKTLPPINGISCERDGDKINLTIKKMQIDRNTNMLQGGALYYKSTLPDTVGDGTERTFSRSELLTSGKPYDGLYLGDVTASDAVTETILWLPENENGKIKLVPFIVLSINYLGGVYVTRKDVKQEYLSNFGSTPDFGKSNVYSWLTGTYLNSILNIQVAEQVMECDVPVTIDGSTATTQKLRAWVPSSKELDPDSVENGGQHMPYFKDAVRRRALLEGTTTGGVYWMRTASSTLMVFVVGSDGGFGQRTVDTNSIAIRPSFVLPKDFKIQQRPDGSYTVYGDAGLMTLSDIDASILNTATVFNMLEVIKATQDTRMVKYAYVKKNYNGSDGGLFSHIDNAFASSNQYGSPLWTQTNSYQLLLQYISAKNASGASGINYYLHSSIQDILLEVPVKSRVGDSGEIQTHNLKVFELGGGECGYPAGNPYDTGSLIPYFSVQGNRALPDGSGNPSESWMRDCYANGASSAHHYPYWGQDGQIGVTSATVGAAKMIRPNFVIPLNTPVRQLADGTYDLVPNDPSLLSTYAPDITVGDDEEKACCQLRDVPISDNEPVYVNLQLSNNSGYFRFLMLFREYGGDTQSGVLLSENIIQNGAFDEDTSAPIAYPDTTIDENCISFTKNFSDATQKYLRTTSVIYATGSGNNVSTINRNCFILSNTELGLTAAGPTLGTASPYMSKSASNRIAKLSGNASSYWTRGMGTSATSLKVVNASGELQDSYASNASNGIRPAISLSLDGWVQKNSDGTYTFIGDEPDQNDTINMEIPWPEDEEFYARMFTYNSKKQWQTMLSNAVATTNPDWNDEDGIAPDPILGNNTPEQIQAAVDQGIYKELWNIGDELTIFVGDANYVFQLADFDHDPISGAGKTAAMTFIMKDLMNTQQKMNNANTNSTSFVGSALYSYIANTLYPSIPEEWRNIMKKVDKKTSVGNKGTSIRTDSYNLFIPAEVEIFGNATYSVAGEGALYPLYSTGSYRVKLLANGTGSATWWWLRSPHASSSTDFCFVHTDGSPSNDYADSLGGVCLGFCV